MSLGISQLTFFECAKTRVFCKSEPKHYSGWFGGAIPGRRRERLAKPPESFVQRRLINSAGLRTAAPQVEREYRYCQYCRFFSER